MQVVYDASQMPSLLGSVVTDGMFDGVHLGHQQILKQVVSEGKKLGLPTVLVTYWPHPRHILTPQQEKLKILTTLKEKADLVGQQGIDYMLVLSFTKLFSQLSHQDFVSSILAETLHTRKIIVGYDHRFGKDRLGDIFQLRHAGQTYNFDIQEIAQQDIEEIAISSTKIRYALQHHLVEMAAQFLGRNYALAGTMVKGDQRGRTIGYPTANLELDEPHKLVPADGVYATRTHIGGVTYHSMTNIGFRPTVDGKKHTNETHIFDFDKDIYGAEIEVEFVKPLRMEKKLDSLEALKSQLAYDRLQALEILKND